MNILPFIPVHAPARELGFLADAGFSLMMSEVAKILGSLLLVVGAIILWAVYLRKKGHRRKHRRHREIIPTGPAPVPGSREQSGVPANEGRRRRRRSQHVERPLNPTLAQSGGLPPIRDDETPPRGL